MATRGCPLEFRPALDLAAAGRYVLGRRTAIGGYSFYRTPEWGVDEPSATDTLAALESLRILGVNPPDPEATVAWLHSLQEPDGSYPTLTIAWSCIRSLALLGAAPERPVAGYLGGVASRVLSRREASDWGAALRDAERVTELGMLGYLEHGPEQAQSIAAMLDRARDPDGGWASPGADVVETARALRLAAPEDAEVARESAALLARCEDEQLGVRFAPRTAATSAEVLRAGLEIARRTGVVLRFPASLERSLVLMQRVDGGLGARHRAISTLVDTLDGLRANELLDDGQSGQTSQNSQNGKDSQEERWTD